MEGASRSGRRAADRGAVAVEYAAVLALVVVAAMVGLAILGQVGVDAVGHQAGCVSGSPPSVCPPRGGLR